GWQRPRGPFRPARSGAGGPRATGRWWLHGDGGSQRGAHADGLPPRRRSHHPRLRAGGAGRAARGTGLLRGNRGALLPGGRGPAHAAGGDELRARWHLEYPAGDAAADVDDPDSGGRKRGPRLGTRPRSEGDRLSQGREPQRGGRGADRQPGAGRDRRPRLLGRDRADPFVAAQPLPLARPELGRGDHPSDRPGQAPHPSAFVEVHEGDGGGPQARAGDREAQGEVRGRPGKAEPGDDGALSAPQGQPARRLSADAGPDAGLDRAVHHPALLRGAVQRALHRRVDLRPDVEGSVLRPPAGDGADDVPHAEDAADAGGRGPAEDPALLHADLLHAHHDQPAGGTDPLLLHQQRAVDRTAAPAPEADGRRDGGTGAAGALGQEGIEGLSGKGRGEPCRKNWNEGRRRKRSRKASPAWAARPKRPSASSSASRRWRPSSKSWALGRAWRCVTRPSWSPVGSIRSRERGRSSRGLRVDRLRSPSSTSPTASSTATGRSGNGSWWRWARRWRKAIRRSRAWPPAWARKFEG